VTLVPLAEAQARVIAGCVPLHPLGVPLDEALGCVTSVPITAEEPVPPFANTAMDGFAVRAGDTAGAPVRLKVVATLAAGADPAGVSVGQGEAVRIMTGAAIPDGADAIVMVERTRTEGEEVVIGVTVEPGAHVRLAGDDIKPGQEVFPAGTELGPGHLGVLASLGFQKAPVYPRARVGVLSTGDELVEGAVALRPGQIRDSNRRTLLALARQSGFEAIDLGLVRDDADAIAVAIQHGVETCDALVTSGGVSVGDFDHVKAVLDRLGRMRWMQVAIKPAKPFAFGTIAVGDLMKPVFGLPGNPVSSMVSFELFARPGIRRLMGHPPEQVHRRRQRAIAGAELKRRPDGKVHFARVTTEVDAAGRLVVRSAGGQASHLLHAMAMADALAVLADGEGVAAGEEVEVLLLT
jgi:molybdopterin molybdotransferase